MADWAAAIGTDIADLVDGWPQRWRYPDLLDRPADDQDAAAWVTGAILNGMAEPLTLAEAGRRLIGSGSFEVVDRMVEEAPLTATDVRQLDALLRAARRSRRADHERRLEMLERRRHLMPGAWPAVSPAQRAAIVDRSREAPLEAEKLLVELEKAADDATALRVAELRGMRLALAEPGDKRGQLIDRCIEAGEYEAARALLDRNQAIPDGGPALLPRPEELPDDLPALGILDMLLDGTGSRLPDLERVSVEHRAPPTNDADAWALLRALRAMTRSAPETAPDLAAAQQLVEALHRVLGVTEVAHTVQAVGSAVHARLFFASDGRLPPLRLLSHEGVDLWVGKTAPSAELPRPVVWLVPDGRASAVGETGAAVVGADDLIVLVAPTAEGSPARPADRQIQLLRRIGPALTTHQLIGPDQLVDLSRAHSPDWSLAWLFDLLGYTLDAVARAALLYETGGRPDDLRLVVDALVKRTGTPTDRLRKLGLEHLQAVREDPAVAERRRNRLLAAVHGQPLAEALLLTSVWLAASDNTLRSLTEVVEWLEVLAEVNLSAVGLTTAELTAAADLLVRQKLWVESPVERERFGLPHTGWRDVLSAVDDITTQVRDALWLSEQHRADELVTIHELVVETIDHHNGNLSRDIDIYVGLMAESTDLAERTTLKARITELNEERLEMGAQYEEAKRAAEPRRLRDMIDAQCRRLSVRHALGKIELMVDGGDDVLVTVNDWLLGRALYNLLDNSRHAIDVGGRGVGHVEIRVATRDAPGHRVCVIDIEDSGAGMPDDVVARLRRGERFTTRSGGKGVGFLIAGRWFRKYRGELVVVVGRGSARTGGAHVRATLPVTDANSPQA